MECGLVIKAISQFYQGNPVEERIFHTNDLAGVEDSLNILEYCVEGDGTCLKRVLTFPAFCKICTNVCNTKGCVLSMRILHQRRVTNEAPERRTS